MADEPETAEVASVPSEEELTADLEKALASKDFKQVASVSRRIDQTIKAKEKAEQAEKVAKLDAIKERVASAISKAVKPIVDSGYLDVADGIWYSYDFGEQAPVVRLMKSAPRAARSGGGGGKKFDISTDDMLARHGTETYKETGMTVQQAYESSTDKNYRYAIRQWLLKKENII